MGQTKPAIISFIILWTVASPLDGDWTVECDKCKCVWSSGRKFADCVNLGYSDIPTLSSQIRDIDFSQNRLYELKKEVFANSNLQDIHKLKLQNCSIETVHKFAFRKLLLLIELDLSKNCITKLDKDQFRDNLKLRVLYLSYNKIIKLPEGLFYNMTHLQRITLDHNEIRTIDRGVFKLLPNLQHLNIGYNLIKNIVYDFTENLIKINSINVEGNPWICDCYLESFRQKTLKHNLITTPTFCEKPERLQGRRWSDAVIFACLPQIIEPLPSTQIEAVSSNITLTCKVFGEPQPDVNWESNGRIIDKDPRQNIQRFFNSKGKIGNFTYNNLTITNVNFRDRGEYKCVAKNPGGTDEKNLTLIVAMSGGISGSPVGFNTSLPLIITLTVLAFIIVILIVVLLICCRKRSAHGQASKRRDISEQSEYIGIPGGQEIDKALITDVNPVIKPPRITVPASITAGGTEISDAKRSLLDSDSTFAGDDESRSLDFEHHMKPQYLDPEYRNHAYPPDLLSFPPRASQASPAGSSASTVIITDRVPVQHGPQSPLSSPLYDQFSVYRTLPHSRSQSPFVAPARIPRQGYVTIPRRPRQQSWSSEPPMLSDIGEPLYDNLGLRTTIDGSSRQDLSKQGEASTPKSNRIFPVSPKNCDTIAEHDATSPTSSTLPRNSIQKLSPSRTEWARANAEALRTPENRNSISSLPFSEHKMTKIPPRPPPKPKKKLSTGPLFEDEGEDGTEV